MTGGAARPRVLVVDDEPSIRMLCRINLELDGYEVLEASSLAEARAAIADGPVDAVLLDLHLGVDTSHDFVAECALNVPRIPVALLTGAADSQSAQTASADAVLPKPFDVESLAGTVRRLTAVPR